MKSDFIHLSKNGVVQRRIKPATKKFGWSRLYQCILEEGAWLEFCYGYAVRVARVRGCGTYTKIIFLLINSFVRFYGDIVIGFVLK